MRDYSDFDIVKISTTQLVLNSSVPSYDGDGVPTSEEIALANKIAADKGYEIYGDPYTTWWGWSEYTPEPGDVAVFDWRKRDSHDL